MTKDECIHKALQLVEWTPPLLKDLRLLLDQLWNTAYNQGQEEGYDEGFDQGRSEANIPF